MVIIPTDILESCNVPPPMQTETASPHKPRSGKKHYAVEDIKAAGRFSGVQVLIDHGFPADALDGNGHPCPFPGCGGNDRFSLIDDEAGAVHCRHCFSEKNGDFIAAIQKLRGWSFHETIQQLGEYFNLEGDSSFRVPVNVPGTSSSFGKTKIVTKSQEVSPFPDGPSANESAASIAKRRIELRKTWIEAVIESSDFRKARYLNSRGIKVSPNSWRISTAGKSGKPFLVAQILSPKGAFVGIHKTYLSTQNNGKAEFENPKQLTESLEKGGYRGSAIRLFEPEGDSLDLAEGIETSLAVHQATNLPIWATISAPFMIRVEIPANITTVRIFADNDTNDAGQDAAFKAARRFASMGVTVYVLIPPEPGTDWNDVLQSGGVEAIQAAMGAAIRVDPPAISQDAAKREPGTFSVGEWVSPTDRDNWGTIDSDLGNGSYMVQFVGKEGTARVEFKGADLRGQHSDYKSVKPTRELKVISIDELLDTHYETEFLVDSILVSGQAAVIGGKSKVLKTSIAEDLLFSMATGTAFLNKFLVKKQRCTLFLSGESGYKTIQETIRRIARSRGITGRGAKFFTGEDLPQISKPEDLSALAELIKKIKAEVFAIDPAYLCLLAGSNGKQASQVFDMGPILMGLTEVSRDTKSTPILLHHFRKNSPNDRFSPPELEELSSAGFAEWARQWILIERRKKYEPGSGHHELWASVGGSAGHGGLWGIDIDEGQNDIFTGRDWCVKIVVGSQASVEARQSKESQKDIQNREKVLAALAEFPEGETKKVLREFSGVNGTVIANVIAKLLKEDAIEKTTVKKDKTTCEIFKFKPGVTFKGGQGGPGWSKGGPDHAGEGGWSRSCKDQTTPPASWEEQRLDWS